MLVRWGTVIAVNSAAHAVDVVDIRGISLIAIIERVAVLSESSAAKLVLASHGIPCLHGLSVLDDDLHIGSVHYSTTCVAQQVTLVRQRGIGGVKLIAGVIVTRGPAKLAD